MFKNNRFRLILEHKRKLEEPIAAAVLSEYDVLTPHRLAGGGGEFGYEYSCKTSSGAVLLLESEGEQSGLRDLAMLRKYTAENYKKWQSHARRRGFISRSVFKGPFLIKSHVKTSGWHISVMEATKEHTRTIRATANALVANSSLTFSPHQSYTTGTPPHSGRDVVQDQKSQCVFVSYYRAKSRVLPASPKVIKAGAGPDHPGDMDNSPPQGPEVASFTLDSEVSILYTQRISV